MRAELDALAAPTAVGPTIPMWALVIVGLVAVIGVAVAILLR